MLKKAITLKNGDVKLYAVLLLWVVGLLMLTFFAERTNFGSLIFWSSLSFIAYFLLIGPFDLNEKTTGQLLWVGIIFRLAAVFAFPLLSDDIYRFFWDGRLMLADISPFAELPSHLVASGMCPEKFDIELFEKLNSKEYYSVYPSVCQFVFATGAFLFPKNIYGFAVFLKGFLFFCEVGTLYFLRRMGVSGKKLLLYALNPLIVLELCGNAHFEAAMLFFFVAALYSLNIHGCGAKKTSLASGALLLSLSIASKLLSIIFLPFLIKQLGWKKGVGLVLLAGIFSALLFAPFYDKNFIPHFTSSVSLYFRNFEFNASFYYVLKAIGNAVYGYTPVTLIAGIANVLLVIGAACLYWGRRDFFSSAFLLMTLYLLLQRAVHPWYLSTLVLLSAFVPWRFGLLWSGLVVLSYSHYNQNFYTENTYLLAVEYLLLLGFMLWEFFLPENKSLLPDWFNSILK